MDKWKIGTPECGVLFGLIGALIALLLLSFKAPDPKKMLVNQVAARQEDAE